MVSRTKKQSTEGRQQASGVKVGKLSLRKERVKDLSPAEKKQVKGGKGATTGDWSCLQVISCITK
jgi:hypothetical protein